MLAYEDNRQNENGEMTSCTGRVIIHVVVSSSFQSYFTFTVSSMSKTHLSHCTDILTILHVG